MISFGCFDTLRSDDTSRSALASSHERTTDCNRMNIKDFTSPNSTDVGWGVTGTAAALFAAIALLIGLDVLADYRAGTDVGHLLTEGLVMALALVGATALWRQLGAARRRAETLTVDLAARREADRFREEARTLFAVSAKRSTASSLDGS